ncbi:MAG: tetratricopeptide repeat protein [Chamaesiphon sp.]|nr:tetratricopeptide repeat protein [Chamaesiphon sp.]
MANQMISAFTPSLMSHEELETILVQRQDLAQELFEKIVLSATTPAKHYALLIGMRGMGKTHLVALIYYRLLAEFEKTPTLKDKLVIAWLREEEWGVDSWLDLVSRILRALAVEEPQSKSRLEELRQISIEDSIDRAAANATRLLKEAIGNRTLLLIMENLDDLFKGLGEAGQQQFRSFLQEEQCCTILATTPALFTAVQSRTKPFFGFFNPIHLDRLTVPEAIEMLGKIATLGGQEDLASFLQTPLGRARVRAVHHLAGGNPRVYMLFSQFITRDALDSLVQAFMKMLDDLTPYYQARMKELSNQQRKIVELLVDKRYAVMVKEIAADCFIDAGTAASQLRELRKMGYVESTQDKRESLYELREVLMRLCLEVKKQRGQWVEIFVEFLRIWYPLSERKNQLELMRGSSLYIKDEHLERALLSEEDPCSISSQRDLHQALNEEQQLLAVDTLEELLHNQRLTEKNHQELLELVKTARYSEAQDLLSKVISRSDLSGEKLDLSIGLQWLEGAKLLLAGRYLEALKLFDLVLTEKDIHLFWTCRGVALDELGRHEEAIESFDRSLSIKPDDYVAWAGRGIALARSQRYEEAIESFDRAISIKPTYQNACCNRGSSLGSLGRYEEAIESFDRALSPKPDDYVAWAFRGNSLGSLGRYEEAIESYDRAISIKPDDYKVWYKRGNSLGNLGRYDESIESYDTALSIDPNYHEAWNNRGLSLYNLGRYEWAIGSYDRAVSIDPNYHEAWNNRGNSLDALGRHEEAIESYGHAISIKSDDNKAWFDRGFSLIELGRYEEAIESYDIALSIDPNTYQAIQNKGYIYLNLGKYVEAIDCFNQAIAIGSDNYYSWHNKGIVQFLMGEYSAALASWQQTFQIIQQLTPLPNDIDRLISDVIKGLISRFSLPNSQPQISTLLSQLIPIYQTAQVLPELSTALIATLPQILAPNINDYTADQWLALWQNLLSTEPALEMPLRLMNTAIAYKKQPAQQKRLWLGLAKEERSILDYLR